MRSLSVLALLARPSGGHGRGGGENALPGRPQAASRADWESALRSVACALRCAKLRVVRKHFVLPLRGAHLLQLVEGRAAPRLLRGLGEEAAPQRRSVCCTPVQHIMLHGEQHAGAACGVGETALALYCLPRRVARGTRGAARGPDGARERAR